MARFNLLHCIPDLRLHGLFGYAEVMESVRWGLAALGHEVGSTRNQAAPGAANIVFGAQMLSAKAVENLPADSIVYNLEQLRGAEAKDVRPGLRQAARRLRVWDYSASNLETWRLLGAEATHVPVGYAPTLSRIAKPEAQDIDVLLYGTSGEKRLRAFHELSIRGVVTVFVSGLYGPARDGLIARSKLVANINLYDFAQIFEVVRVSYLLANRKAVVATLDERTAVEPDLREALRFCTPQSFVQACARLLENPAERQAVEELGFARFSARDVRAILSRALG